MAEDKLSREYVVELLKRDAERKAEEYKTRGAAAFTTPPPQKPITTNTNKRFLSNLMKSTHSHNDRILKKDRPACEENPDSRGRSHQHSISKSNQTSSTSSEKHKSTHKEHRSDRRKKSRSRSPKRSHRRHRSRKEIRGLVPLRGRKQGKQTTEISGKVSSFQKKKKKRYSAARKL